MSVVDLRRNRFNSGGGGGGTPIGLCSIYYETNNDIHPINPIFTPIMLIFYTGITKKVFMSGEVTFQNLSVVQDIELKLKFDSIYTPILLFARVGVNQKITYTYTYVGLLNNFDTIEVMVKRSIGIYGLTSIKSSMVLNMTTDLT